MKFSDYEIGSTRKSFGRTITEADIVTHAGQTGDFYPHHMDAEWCATQPFGQRMAHGTLIISVGVGMMAGEINPDAMSYGYDKIRFIKPVFIGDTIKVTTEITGLASVSHDICFGNCSAKTFTRTSDFILCKFHSITAYRSYSSAIKETSLPVNFLATSEG